MAGTFYEFFAGGGMARAGLGSGWECLFANDIDADKASSYRENWVADEFELADVGRVTTARLPGSPDLAWASFPCQDLSLAGAYKGLAGARSGTFWPFWQLMLQLRTEGRSPRMIVLENVFGALTSHGGEDFRQIAGAFAKAKYRFGAMIIDARLFVPQSRPRLFIIGVREDVFLPSGLTSGGPIEPWHTKAVQAAYAGLPETSRQAWLWWAPPLPKPRKGTLEDLIEDEPSGVSWNSTAQTQYLLSLMNALHTDKVRSAQVRARETGRNVVGGVYRRTREGRQRAEVRFDGLAGCLRTPAGGSSRQAIIVVGPRQVRSRLVSPREAARLMGLPDSYRLPENYNQAYQLVGDGVVVPVVRHIAKTLLEPMTAAQADLHPSRIAAQ
ncbi:DNA cytosine methyltransferase [Mesorhizobium sp. BR1-1-9]|uniref:DNA cytosine methyltransferase n=1 Tax=Mesorhizobium sp. BR1-1-9 TaxID=2876646 RepID=UPI001CD0EEA4|nr:DNA cytosine methyltransferase [Mesorhizobium sp. BR1-1-9]MBZ9871591.1 DNA cytosine methyltransferase [Mesorhizobium sp. BR1-1-9]